MISREYPILVLVRPFVRFGEQHSVNQGFRIAEVIRTDDREGVVVHYTLRLPYLLDSYIEFQADALMLLRVMRPQEKGIWMRREAIDAPPFHCELTDRGG